MSHNVQQAFLGTLLNSPEPLFHLLTGKLLHRVSKKISVDVDSGGNMSRAADFPDEVHDQSADLRGLCGGTCNLLSTDHSMQWSKQHYE